MEQQLVQIELKAEKFVRGLLGNHLDPAFVFHNMGHTLRVVQATYEIEKNYSLSAEELFVLHVSAWFHDTGFCSGKAEGHEAESAKLALNFLSHWSLEKRIIRRIAAAIMATRLPQHPANLVEKMLCDADLFHLGSAAFLQNSELLRKERELCQQREISEEEWRILNLEFLTRHHYFTDWCRQMLEPVKNNWIQILSQDRKASA